MKRRRQPQRQQDSSQPLRRSRRVKAQSHPPLFDALRPLLPLFHALLPDDVAARLLRTSRTTALALLPGYTFTSHIFRPASLASMRSLRDLCALYRLRITQLALPERLKHLTFDSAPPHLSPIPASVVTLTLGQPYSNSEHSGAVRRWAALSAAARDWQDREPWRLPDYHPSPQWFGAEGKGWQLTRWMDEPDIQRLDCPLPYVPCRDGILDCPLPPGLLPEGLRVLQLSDEYKHTLQPGSLPSTLTFLQLGWFFDQPLAPGVLPASLLYLSVTGNMHNHHALLQASLPASLERLRLPRWPHPLQAGMWPAGLKALHFGENGRPLQPHALPSSLLYLAFSWSSHPLLPDVLPSSLIELHLGQNYTHPLPPGVLPSSLRRLTLGAAFCQVLQVGSLPEGLLFLSFSPGPSILPALQPGALPSTLLGIDLTNRCKHPLPAGVIPSSVRWVRLPSRYRCEHIEAVLPAHAEVRWYAS